MIEKIKGRKVRIVDEETGELLPFEALMVEDVQQASRDGQDGKMLWWRAMLPDLVRLLDDVSGKQVKAVSAVLSLARPEDGLILETQEDMAKRAGVSLRTMNIVIQLMSKHDLIRRKTGGVYMVNPSFLSQGKWLKVEALVVKYNNISNLQVIDGAVSDLDHAAEG